ncbi:MAG: hypothetical protein R3C58_01795 [Parvularculaceae bacterium]
MQLKYVLCALPLAALCAQGAYAQTAAAPQPVEVAQPQKPKPPPVVRKPLVDMSGERGKIHMVKYEAVKGGQFQIVTREESERRDTGKTRIIYNGQ